MADGSSSQCDSLGRPKLLCSTSELGSYKDMHAASIKKCPMCDNSPAAKTKNMAEYLTEVEKL